MSTSPMTGGWFSAKELAGLPGLPGTEQNVREYAKRHNWEGQRRLGTKAMEYAFAVLPIETQSALLARVAGDAEPVVVETEIEAMEGAELPTQQQLSDDQRRVMIARVAFVREIERLCRLTSQKRAVETLVDMARKGELSPYLNARVSIANDRKTATRTLSERTLKRWLADFRQHGERGLAPKRRQKDMSIPDWSGEFLKRYQRPQKPSVEAAYQVFIEQTKPPHPSIHQVRRFLAKLSPEARERGRMGSREIKALKAFKRRDASHLLPNDIWVADGHTFDAEVINPETGKPFRPEVTLVLDWATRRAVGFGLHLAESTLTTVDALRYSVSRAGMFGTFYVDNGSGFANDTVREVVDRLGGQMTHSLPYNSQARGVIERSHRSVLVPLAKTMDSYIGADMDPEAANRVHKLSRKAIKEGLSPTQLPSFQEFHDRLDAALDAYNYRPHSALAKIRDLETGRMRHQSPMEAWRSAEAEGWEAITADADVVASLMRPQQVRKTHRGEVRINSGIYFLDSLVDFHGEEVKVAWDYRNVGQVGVFTLDGEWIGEAMLDGNATPAMPVAMVEKGRQKRIKGQLNTLTKKAETLTGQKVEIRTVTPAPASPGYDRRVEDARAYARQLANQAPRFEIPGNDVERYREWMRLDARVRGGETLCDGARRFYRNYCHNPDFRVIAQVMNPGMDVNGLQPVHIPEDV